MVNSAGVVEVSSPATGAGDLIMPITASWNFPVIYFVSSIAFTSSIA